MTFRFEQKILFKHCDPAGIVFYPRYMEMMNDVVEDWFATDLGLPFEEMHAESGVPTVSITAEFRVPSRHGDRLMIALLPTRLGASSVDLELEATCKSDVRFISRLTLVNISMETMRPIRWPDALRARIAAALPRNAQLKDENHAAE